MACIFEKAATYPNSTAPNPEATKIPARTASAAKSWAITGGD
ncbi:MAG TPA: hypothetical protein VFG14_14380 [Chthoniobacteraceae bacterium]|nr:hypothetical protein [Chthoniobacteraceae bacterium]